MVPIMKAMTERKRQALMNVERMRAVMLWLGGGSVEAGQDRANETEDTNPKQPAADTPQTPTPTDLKSGSSSVKKMRHFQFSSLADRWPWPWPWWWWWPWWSSPWSFPWPPFPWPWSSKCFSSPSSFTDCADVE